MEKDQEAEETKRALEKTVHTFRTGQTTKDVQENYDQWSTNYEDMLNTVAYRAPFITVDEVVRLVPVDQRATVRILDVAAGTGWVGQELSKKGFNHFDALEPSEGMLKLLSEKGLYTNMYPEFVGLGNNSVPSDTYDVVLVSGGMGEGHIPVSGVDDLVRFAKPGGLVIIVMRLEFLNSVEMYRNKLEPHMEQLERVGMWKKISRTVVPSYFYHKEGVIFSYRVI